MALPARALRPLSRALRLIKSPVTKAYHSYTHPAPPSYPPAESAILSAALERVPDHGFTSRSLTLGAQDAGYLSISTNLLPRGVFELVLYYLVSRREGLKDVLERGEGKTLREVWDKQKLGTGGRVRELVLERLRANVESGIIGRWQEALAILAQPTYLPASTHELWSLADEIWFLAGDTSVDTSYYTKRASLSAIYAATEVFQTQDQSTEFKDTERFLDERLGDLRTLGTTVGNVGEWISYTAGSVVNVARSRGMRI